MTGTDIAAPGDQPPPQPVPGAPSVHAVAAEIVHGRVPDVVIADLMERAAVGLQRYGTPLQAGNGRDARWDGYQEALDGLAYAGQLVAETEGDVVSAEVGEVLEAQLAACEAWAVLLHPEIVDDEL